MTLKTTRLTLRPWVQSDDVSLYYYAKNPAVGPAAGWSAHKNIEESRYIIKKVLAIDETYALVLNGTDVAIGSIGLMLGDESDNNRDDTEAEIGYWIGEPFWGQGLMPEAVREIMRHGFEDLKLKTLWCCHYEGNTKSKRVQEKCGFKYHHTIYNKPVPLLNETRTDIVNYITDEQWKQMGNVEMLQMMEN